MADRIFDKIRFDVGDIVIRKNKTGTPKAKPETVCREELVTNLDGFSYSVIYFESSSKSFNVGFEFEPVNEELCKEYYKIWNTTPTKTKAKSKKRVKKNQPVIFKL